MDIFLHIIKGTLLIHHSTRTHACTRIGAYTCSRTHARALMLLICWIFPFSYFDFRKIIVVTNEKQEDTPSPSPSPSLSLSLSPIALQMRVTTKDIKQILQRMNRRTHKTIVKIQKTLLKIRQVARMAPLLTVPLEVVPLPHLQIHCSHLHPHQGLYFHTN